VKISLPMQFKVARVPEPVTEYRFDITGRRWRFDYAWPEKSLALEVDGGGFVNGRHSRGTGIEKDAEKYNAALIQGWRVLRVTPKHVNNGMALAWVQEMLKCR
jgi:very-short-patch-repair endonuclease